MFLGKWLCLEGGQCVLFAGDISDFIWLKKIQLLASCGLERHINLWQIPIKNPVYKLEGHQGSIQQVCRSNVYSLSQLECHFFSLKSQLLIVFSRSLLPRFIENRPMKLRLECVVGWHPNALTYCKNHPKKVGRGRGATMRNTTRFLFLLFVFFDLSACFIWRVP